MKRPLFDVILSAHTGEDGTGAFDVRVVGRYTALDGHEIAAKENVSFEEGVDFATEAVDTFMAGVMSVRAN